MFSGTRADLFSVGNTSAGAVYGKSRSICTGLWCRYGLVARTVGQNQVEDQSLRQISLCKNPPRQDCKSWVYWNRFAACSIPTVFNFASAQVPQKRSNEMLAVDCSARRARNACCFVATEIRLATRKQKADGF